MIVYGELPEHVRRVLEDLVLKTIGLEVTRKSRAKSSKPLPGSEDLEVALVPHCQSLGLSHHLYFEHPGEGRGYEYDFWAPQEGVALEVMGYRADDEVYKNLLKFHVHPETRIGVVLVPRWKWVSGKRQDRNYAETVKALAFAEGHMALEALVAIAYDWEGTEVEGKWRLRYV